MFSHMFLFLLLSLLICKQDCAVSRTILTENKRTKGNALEFVVNKYIKPLRKLTAQLPNHAIELQIEILDQAPSPSVVPVPQRRLIRVSNRHPKKIARSVDDTSPTGAATSNVSSVTPASSTLSSPATTTEGQTSASSNRTGTTLDTARKPVYMEDLNKALTDLEKRLAGKSSSHTINITPCSEGVKVQPLKSPNTQSGTVRNIAEILQLLKKAVQVERHIPQPHDDNLDWVQIKIPKDIR